MLSTSHFAFTFARNRPRVVAAVVCGAAVVGTTLIGLPLFETELRLVVETPDNYWNALLPLAQFVVISSLAYLALEIFHTSGVVETLVFNLFGENPGDRAALVQRLEGPARANLASNLPQGSPLVATDSLYICMMIYQLCAWRLDWIVGSPQPRKAVETEIDKDYAEAAVYDWFKSVPGKHFLRPFHTGADLIWPTFALALTFWIHVMASVEKMYSTNIMWWAVTPFGKALLPAAMVWCGVVLPVWYATSGRKLLDGIRSHTAIAKVLIEQYEGQAVTSTRSSIQNARAQMRSTRAGAAPPAGQTRP